MEDELERLWEGFNLTEEEKLEVPLSEVATRRSKLRGKKSLIIFIVMEKSLNREALKLTMTKLWNPEGRIVFNEVGHNRFIIEFHKEVDIERVLKGIPWSFDKHLICVQDFDSSTPPTEINFTHEPFWIQLHGMPLAAMNIEGGESIGASVGEVITVDVDGEGIEWGKFLRIRLNMDITKPLARGRLIRMDRTQRWIEFKNERLPLLCFQCRIVRHLDRNCAFTKNRSQTKVEEKSQYGQWLRATTINSIGRGDNRYGGKGNRNQATPNQMNLKEQLPILPMEEAQGINLLRIETEVATEITKENNYQEMRPLQEKAMTSRIINNGKKVCNEESQKFPITEDSPLEIHVFQNKSSNQENGNIWQLQVFMVILLLHKKKGASSY
ncbi:uncharacterized protein LOC121239512 [Juglans microcarpa x Juglans regia]|uniref:uncharacterized protein LOC121239512 n=1 Tax=Juglans microcarpa x Juglans regia TaxID=2249226 RepID=UPI001B7E9741|nr:uncharacterized protein LOC121239512 [Juglans microcarpa x Juglans regia]